MAEEGIDMTARLSDYDILNVMREVLVMATLQIEDGVPETKDYVLSRLRELVDLPAKKVRTLQQVVMPEIFRIRLERVIAEIPDLQGKGFIDSLQESLLLDLHKHLADADRPTDERGMFEETQKLSFIVEFDEATNQYKEVVRSNDSQELTKLANAGWKAWQARAALPQQDVPLTGDARTFDEGIRRARDLVLMAAANRSNDEVVREMEDLALSILEEAPRYKTQWTTIGMLSKELHQARKELAEAKAQLASMSRTSAP
jgi:hypothetical protein